MKPRPLKDSVGRNGLRIAARSSRQHRPAPVARLLIVLPFAFGTIAQSDEPTPPRILALPVVEGPFLRPVPGEASEPVWGIEGGIAVGLWPTPGPRGLIRIYTPYLDQPRLKPMNFIAIEPVVGRVRGLSELEISDRDGGVAGKAMGAGDTRDDDPLSKRRPPWQPARGTIATVDGTKVLTVFVFVEPFANGARPIVEVQLRQDRPHEVRFRVFNAPDGAPMRSCILTATMGNYARLRRLWLRDQVVDARAVYEPFRPDALGFAPHREWPVDSLRVADGWVIVAATPDEPEPGRAEYDADVPVWWHYRGLSATQYWRAPIQEGLVARVNGRRTYWASRAAIPGGVSFENFELEVPFEPGQEFIFGITRESLKQLGFQSE